jgi:hypothetical protein
MSLTQYQKVLNIAESLLKKVDIPEETLRKYEELKLRLIGDAFLDTSSHSTNHKNSEYQLLMNQSVIDVEIISVYSNFLGTISNIFDHCLSQTIK